LLVHVTDRLEHDERDRQRRRARQLAGRRLDEVGARGHRQEARAAHVVVGAELAGLQDHLEMGIAAPLLPPHHLPLDPSLPARTPRGTFGSRPQATPPRPSPIPAPPPPCPTPQRPPPGFPPGADCPEGTAAPTDAPFTPLPRNRSRATGTRFG